MTYKDVAVGCENENRLQTDYIYYMHLYVLDQVTSVHIKKRKKLCGGVKTNGTLLSFLSLSLSVTWAYIMFTNSLI